jgi:hypothetical protein
MAADLSHLSGWLEDGGHAVFAAQAKPLYSAGPDLVAADSALLYKAWKDVGGSYPDYPAQQIGDCTSFASGHATDLLQNIQIVNGHPAKWKEICTEAVYGIGREIAGMLGGIFSSDGCYGGAVAKALTDFGGVPREAVGAYSGQRAKQWGRSGVPSDVKKLCADHKLGAAALVTTTDELAKALSNLYPGIVCSNQGFTMTRDANGMCRASGSWAHAMAIIGFRTRAGAREFLIGQSWGDNTPSGPTVDDQPNWSFWINEPTMASMLRGQDSYVFSGFAAFDPQPLPSHWSWSTAA